jgi:topoisomerase-4 subunit A
LARLEGIRIEKEIKQLDKERKELTRLLSNNAALREQVASEIDADTLTYGDDRRTLIQESQRATTVIAVVDEPVTVLISKKHWGRTRQGHGLDLSTVSFKDGDGLLEKFECRTTDHCIVICDNGRVCSIPVSQLPSGRGDGVPLATLIELASGAKIAHVLCGKSEQQILIATAAGYGFTAAIGDMVGRNKAGKQFISVDKEAILPPALFTPTEQSLVAAASSGGRLLLFLLAEMKHLQGGGKGVIVMGLAEGEELVTASVISQAKIEVIGTTGTREHTIKLSGESLQSYFGKRARGGKSLPVKFKPKRIE